MCVGLNDDHDDGYDDDRMMTLHRLTVWLMKPAWCLLHGLGLGLPSIYHIIYKAAVGSQITAPTADQVR